MPWPLWEQAKPSTPAFSTAEMGGGGAELFTPAYWSYLLMLVALLGHRWCNPWLGIQELFSTVGPDGVFN